MKRRLCIGIALIGGSRFIIMDEPTAGVDESSFDYRSTVTRIIAEVNIPLKLSDETDEELVFSITPHREYIVPKRKMGFLRRIKKSLEKRIDMNTEQVVLMNDRGRNTSDNSDTKSIGPEGKSSKLVQEAIMLPIALLFACELYSKIQNIDSQVMLTISQSPLPLVQSLFGNDTDSYVRCVSGVPSLRDELSMIWAKMRKEDRPLRVKTMVTASGCAYGSSSGTFNFDFNRSIAYNADLICDCMDNLGWNCTQENYPLPSLSSFTLNTTERVWDLSFRNISQMRMATRNSVNKTSDSPFFMGGFSLGHKNFRARNSDQINTAKKGWIELLEGKFFLYSVILNLFVLYLFSLILSVFYRQKLLVFRITIIVLALCIIPASFTVFLVEDRVSDSYHLQIVSGLSKNIYWLTGYLFDMKTIIILQTVYTLSIILILLIYIMLGVKEITYSVATFLSFFLLFWIYGYIYIYIYKKAFSATLWNYILQRFFRVPALSFVMIAMGTFFLGIVGSLTIIIIEEMMKRDPTLKTSHTICSYLFLMLPQYNLGMAMFRGSFVYQLVQIGESYLTDLNRPDLVHALPIPYVLEWDLMGIHCIFLLFHILFAAIILMLVEHKSIGFLSLNNIEFTSNYRRKEIEYTKRLLEEDSKEEDVDVIKEQRRIEAIENMEGAPLIVKRLAKAYSPSHLFLSQGNIFIENIYTNIAVVCLLNKDKLRNFGVTRRLFSICPSGIFWMNHLQVWTPDLNNSFGKLLIAFEEAENRWYVYLSHQISLYIKFFILQLKTTMSIEDFSLSQSTLNDVFQSLSSKKNFSCEKKIIATSSNNLKMISQTYQIFHFHL
uniref:ABC transporter domain-containing protein n=1 Tax=Heterorhabditis bacteriophora TaxID=37862 RepID=A0A1I7WXT1_HETBA